MLKINELEIYNKLTSGASINGLAREYGVDKKKIRSIRENGKYYLNLITGEIKFTAKAIAFEEQLFHYIYNALGDDLTDLIGRAYGKPEKLLTRAIVPRLACFMIGHFKYDYSKKKSFEVKLWGWAKKKDKLVGCDENGTITQAITDILEKFQKSEVETISKNYYLDENGLPRGWNLWSVKISDEWLYYLKKYINESLKNKDFLLNKTELAQIFLNKFLKEKKETKDINLIQELNKNIKHNYMNSWVACLLIKKYGNEVFNRLYSDDKYRILYLEKSAYYNGLVPPEMEKILIEYL